MDMEEMRFVREALRHALTQTNDTTTERLIVQEFWHSLNRKGVVKNNDVQPLIDLTLNGH